MAILREPCHRYGCLTANLDDSRIVTCYYSRLLLAKIWIWRPSTWLVLWQASTQRLLLLATSAFCSHWLMNWWVSWLLLTVKFTWRGHKRAKIVVAAILLLQAPPRDIDATRLATIGMRDMRWIEITDSSCAYLVVWHCHDRFSCRR